MWVRVVHLGGHSGEYSEGVQKQDREGRKALEAGGGFLEDCDTQARVVLDRGAKKLGSLGTSSSAPPRSRLRLFPGVLPPAACGVA